MGTRALLGIKLSDGSIQGCYIAMDGYPNHMIPAIEDYVKRHTITGLYIHIVKAQTVGGMRVFNAPETGTILLDLHKERIIGTDSWNSWDAAYGTDYKYMVNYSTGNIEITETSE